MACGGPPAGKELARVSIDGDSYFVVEYGEDLAIFSSDGSPVASREQATRVLHSYAWGQELSHSQ